MTEPTKEQLAEEERKYEAFKLRVKAAGLKRNEHEIWLMYISSHMVGA